MQLCCKSKKDFIKCNNVAGVFFWGGRDYKNDIKRIRNDFLF